MKFDNIRIYNFENALRGMRNPKNSWDRGDSEFGPLIGDAAYDAITDVYYRWHPEEAEKTSDNENALEDFYQNAVFYNGDMNIIDFVAIGPNDMKLASALVKGGSEHRKFLRQIIVTVDITAPLYWWKEFDTYKVGTVANSTSTMHKITSKPIDISCFEIDDYMNVSFDGEDDNFIVNQLIPYLEKLRLTYLELIEKAKGAESNEADNLRNQAKIIWKELIRWLPESWLQTRTVTLNYEVLHSICHQRANHKLAEWSDTDIDNERESFLKFAYSLPYAKEFIFE